MNIPRLLTNSDTQKLKAVSTFNICANSFVRAQQIYHAAMLCHFGFPRITREENFQWESNSFNVIWRVSFTTDTDRTYTDIAKELALCMKELKN